MSRQEHQELKISNALANVAVADHDIVAVATVRSAEKLNIIACTQSCNDKAPPSQSPTALGAWRLFFTKNHRRSEARADVPNNDPIISDAKVLADLGFGDEDEEKLRDYVERCV